MANPIDRYINLKIKDQTYKYGYTIKGVIMLEKELDRRSIVRTIADLPLSYGDTYAFWKWGILSFQQMKDDDIEQLLIDYLEENNIVDLQNLLFEALEASHTIGKFSNEKNARKPTVNTKQ